MATTSARPRSSVVDRYIFDCCVRAPPTVNIPPALRVVIDLRNRLRFLFDDAFPPANAVAPLSVDVSFFQRAISAVDRQLARLTSPIELREACGSDYVLLLAEAQLPGTLVDMLHRMLRFRTLATDAAACVEFPSWRECLPLFGRSGATLALIDAAVVHVLKAMNCMTYASDVLAARFAADRRLLPLLFGAILCADSVELTLALIEELLHTPRRTAPFDLASVANLPCLVDALTPFQLGSFCRVLAPLVDERDVPLCGGDHCSGACSLSSSTSHDWQQIESPASQLRARRTYVGAADRVARDRNHAALLAIPGLLTRLVKLISVPPAPREELALVDHALRSGTFTFNLDLAEVAADLPQPMVLQAALGPSMSGDAGGDLVLEPRGPDNAEASEDSLDEVMPPEEVVRQRVLFMAIRRLFGVDSNDSNLAGTDRWEMLDARIARTVADYGNGRQEERLFRERRRQGSMRELGAGFRFEAGENHGTIEISALPSVSANNPSPANLGEPANWVDRDGALGGTDDLLVRHGTRASVRPEDGGVSERETDVEASEGRSLMSINGLLMSSHQVEVLFVLYSLMIGRRKSEVQARLVDAGIFPALLRFCHALDWTESGQETKTEESLKVHFIRLLHYMCDALDGSHAEVRLASLFSKREREMLEAIERGNIPDFPGFYALIQRPPSAVAYDPALLGLQGLSLASSSPELKPSSVAVSDENERLMRHQCPPVLSKAAAHIRAGFADPSYAHVSTHVNVPRGGDRLAKTAADPAWSDTSQKTETLTDEGNGIVCSIVRALVETAGGGENESTRQYLLSGCIETFLRTARSEEKVLIARQGLLSHLVNQLSESSQRTSHVSQFRQTSFDLLGQLVKWNRSLFSAINELFRQDPNLLSKLLTAVSDRLVDSNVFVRSVIISLERFKAEDELEKSLVTEHSAKNLYDFENCVLWEFVETYRTQLIFDLLSSVRVEDINFENICCVNTTLIILVTSCHTEDALVTMLSMVADNALSAVSSSGARPRSLFTVNPIDLFVNFKKLVGFWLSYYQHQGLDVASQELSSNINFGRLVSTARLLTTCLPKIDARFKRDLLKVTQR